MDKTIENPTRKHVVLTMVPSALAIGFFFIIIDPSILMISAMSSVMISIVATAWWVEYHTRPIRVVIEKDGVSLLFRRGRMRFVNWRDIAGVRIRQGDTNTYAGRFNAIGRLKTFDSGGIPVTVEVAQAVVMAYTAATGEPPPIY